MSKENLLHHTSQKNNYQYHALQQLINTPAIKHFYFLRHGSTDWNMNMLILGPQDLSINKKGIYQVTCSASLIQDKKISYIISSGMKRCLETKDIIVKVIQDNHIQIEIDSTLQERNFGDWSLYTKSIQKLFDSQPNKTEIHYKEAQETIESLLPQDAETKDQFILRIAESFVKHLHNSSIQGTPLIISHGCIETVLANLMNHDNINLDYGSILSFDFVDDRWEISKLVGEVMNETT